MRTDCSRRRTASATPCPAAMPASAALRSRSAAASPRRSKHPPSYAVLEDRPPRAASHTCPRIRRLVLRGSGKDLCAV